MFGIWIINTDHRTSVYIPFLYYPGSGSLAFGNMVIEFSSSGGWLIVLSICLPHFPVIILSLGCYRVRFYKNISQQFHITGKTSISEILVPHLLEKDIKCTAMLKVEKWNIRSNMNISSKFMYWLLCVLSKALSTLHVLTNQMIYRFKCSCWHFLIFKNNFIS